MNTNFRASPFNPKPVRVIELYDRACLLLINGLPMRVTGRLCLSNPKGVNVHTERGRTKQTTLPPPLLLVEEKKE